MKITCHACDAKYTIADEKVTGRTVKIKCKKCGATIVVNADTASAPQMGGAAGAPYGDAQPQAPAGDDDSLMATRVAGMDGAPPAVNAPEWTVSMTGEDERQMSQLQIAEEMQRGAITGDTYVWRDGMSDWLPAGQIPELQALLARVASAGHAAHAPAPAPVHEENHGLAGTIVMNEGAPMSPFAAPRPAAGMAAPAPVAAHAPVAATPAPLAAVNQPTAARRANRAGASVDVFAAAQETREHGDRPRPPSPAGKLGERNENSVLFSLSALTATENAASNAKSDDAFDLGLGNGKGSGGGNSFDDLMNIGGGAIGGPMLAPPPLLAPVVEPPPAPMPMQQQMAAPVQAMGAMSPMMSIPAPPPKSKTGLIIGIVAAVAVLGGIGAVFALGGSSGSGSGASGEASVPTAQVSAPATTASAAPTPTVSSSSATTDAPAASGAPVASNAVGSGDSGGKTPAGPGGNTPTGKASSTAATPTASAKTSADPTPTPAPTATAAADPGGGGRDFNKGAATTALSAAAGRAKGCKTADGPTGSASVRVVFAPSGNVTSANVQGPPFAGTPVGGCIASAFRGASVPPVDGSPVAVSKTVNIN